MANTENIYTERGYNNREHYLNCLAEIYDVDIYTVHAMADLLGESEDFDGLPYALEDIEDSMLY